jgi:hypothetical protein
MNSLLLVIGIESVRTTAIFPASSFALPVFAGQIFGIGSASPLIVSISMFYLHYSL